MIGGREHNNFAQAGGVFLPEGIPDNELPSNGRSSDSWMSSLFSYELNQLDPNLIQGIDCLVIGKV